LLRLPKFFVSFAKHPSTDSQSTPFDAFKLWLSKSLIKQIHLHWRHSYLQTAFSWRKAFIQLRWMRRLMRISKHFGELRTT
jgi:hypothetical protein